MQVWVNGSPRGVADGATIASLLEELRLDPRTVAVERNLELATRANHATTMLAEGDRIEIVTLAGGG